MSDDSDAPDSPDDVSPRLVFDDQCGFCTWCARWADRHGDFELVGFHELTPDQRARLPENWEECAHLLTEDAVYSCGESIEQSLVRVNVVLAVVLGALRHVPGYAWLRERLYRWGADNRDLLGKVARNDPPAEDS